MSNITTTATANDAIGVGVTAQTAAARTGDGLFGRIAATGGLVAVIVFVIQAVLAGAAPALDDSAADVAAYFSENGDAHRAIVLANNLISIPLALFFVGVYRSLRPAGKQEGSPWSTLFLFGAVASAATAAVSEGLYAILALREGTGLNPETMRAIYDGSQIALAGIGIWLAVIVGSVGIATLQQKTRTGSYRALCFVVAALGLLAVIDTVSTSTGGIFALLGFLSFVVWVLTTSVIMFRDAPTQ